MLGFVFENSLACGRKELMSEWLSVYILPLKYLFPLEQVAIEFLIFCKEDSGLLKL